MTTSSLPSPESAKRTFETLLVSLADLFTTWAAYGLKVGKLALEQSAEALGKTARTFDTLATELEKKHEATKAASGPDSPPAAA